MTFVSFDFYIFLAIMVVIYYILPLKARWVSLLVGSLGFYYYISSKSIQSFFMLIGAAVICWISGVCIEKKPQLKKIMMIVTLIIILIPLFAIKEAPFIYYNLKGESLPSWWIVPIGIAFYTLQLISYLVEIYNGNINSEKNILKFLLFTSFFPQIIQGPIPRYSQLQHQLINGNRFDERQFVKGFILILWGFFLKLCIADKAGIVVNQVFDNYPTYQGMYILVAGILYSFQLYADFLGCTTLAQGIARLFGIELINNFERPYFSDSIKDFWRRWHISLSSWLRDYIYIPLGGNRRGKFRKYVNLIITFAISGIWHGSGYKFLFWGLLHGFYQIVGEILFPVKKFVDEKLMLYKYPYTKRIIKTVFTFFLVMFAWIIFRVDHLKTSISMIKSIFTVYNPWILTNDALFGIGLEWKEFSVLIVCLLGLLIVGIVQEKGIDIIDKILQCCLPIRWVIYIVAILFIMIFGTYGYGFDAQSFIYGGF